jgi:hypothetical protein
VTRRRGSDDLLVAWRACPPRRNERDDGVHARVGLRGRARRSVSAVLRRSRRAGAQPAHSGELRRCRVGVGKRVYRRPRHRRRLGMERPWGRRTRLPRLRVTAVAAGAHHCNATFCSFASASARRSAFAWSMRTTSTLTARSVGEVRRGRSHTSSVPARRATAWAPPRRSRQDQARARAPRRRAVFRASRQLLADADRPPGRSRRSRTLRSCPVAGVRELHRLRLTPRSEQDRLCRAAELPEPIEELLEPLAELPRAKYGERGRVSASGASHSRSR